MTISKIERVFQLSTTYIKFNIMSLILHGDPRSGFECSCWWSASSMCMKSRSSMSHGPRIGRIYAAQNDKKNDNKINPKTNFKHHRLLTPPWRFAPRETISSIFLCVQQFRPKDKNKVLVLESFRNVAVNLLQEACCRQGKYVRYKESWINT